MPERVRLAAPGEPSVPLMRVAQQRAGTLKGARVVSFMVQWDMARRALADDWPETISEQVVAYADWWRESERTGWREIERFRVVFPGEESPQRLLDAAQAAWDERRGVAGLGALAVAA